MIASLGCRSINPSEILLGDMAELISRIVRSFVCDDGVIEEM